MRITVRVVEYKEVELTPEDMRKVAIEVIARAFNFPQEGYIKDGRVMEDDDSVHGTPLREVVRVATPSDAIAWDAINRIRGPMV